MTPQESELLNDLFDRLATLETVPRDAAAERVIADGLQRAPHAVYALVQTALVQDEALKRANARIEELQAQAADPQAPEERSGSFLDTMREALTGRPPAHGSVPSVRPPVRESQPEAPSVPLQPEAGQPPPVPPGYPGSAPFGSGGSFLGTAASTAAGVLGGALLLNGIRSMFGQQAGGHGPGSAFAAQPSSPGSRSAEPGAANSDLARDLGTDQIGHKAYDTQTDERADAKSVADTDDSYDEDMDDDDDVDEDMDDDDDFDDDDPGDDSY